MISSSFALSIACALPFTLTPSQQKAVIRLEEFLADPSPYSTFLLKGYAGTGKTSLLKGLTQALLNTGIKVCLMAPTGRAARRLSITTGIPAYTIHRLIYKASTAMMEEGGYFGRNKGGEAGTIFIVDEASMISDKATDGVSPFGSGHLLADLLGYVHDTETSKIIFVGDTAQLPPIGTNLSTALDEQVLEDQYGLKVYTCTLIDVVRQVEKSGILQNATALRSLLSSTNRSQGAILIDASFADVHTICGADLVDTLDSAYRRYSREGVMVICSSNKGALTYNLGIRSQILYNDSEIERGDRLVIARNNYAYTKRKDKSDFLANGDLIEVRHLGRSYELYGHHFIDADIYVEDRNEELSVCILIDTLTSEDPQLTYAEREALYLSILGDYADEASVVKRRTAVRKNKYWQALEVKYANALTCHKAQGGQWPAVFVDLSQAGIAKSSESLIRWLYTAITRAENEVFLINAPLQMIE